MIHCWQLPSILIQISSPDYVSLVTLTLWVPKYRNCLVFKYRPTPNEGSFLLRFFGSKPFLVVGRAYLYSSYNSFTRQYVAVEEWLDEDRSMMLTNR
jgi:hypothetical protein